MPYGYDPARYVPSYAGLRQTGQQIATGIQAAGTAIGGYVDAREKVAESKEATLQLLNETKKAYRQKLIDELGYSETQATTKVDHAFGALRPDQITGKNTDTIIKRIELAGNALNNTLTKARQEQVTGVTQAAQRGFTEEQLAQARRGLTPEQYAEQAYQQRELLAPAPRDVTQQEFAQRAGLAATGLGAPPPTMKELKERPEFATAQTETQRLAVEKEKRIAENKQRQLRIRERANQIRSWNVAITEKGQKLKELGNLQDEYDAVGEQLKDLDVEIEYQKTYIEDKAEVDRLKRSKEEAKATYQLLGKLVQKKRGLVHEDILEQADEEAKEGKQEPKTTPKSTSRRPLSAFGR